MIVDCRMKPRSIVFKKGVIYLHRAQIVAWLAKRYGREPIRKAKELAVVVFK